MYQISKQIKAHDGSVFTLCQMRNGMLLTGGGKDRKIILWDHDLNPEREIEVSKNLLGSNLQGQIDLLSPNPWGIYPLPIFWGCIKLSHNVIQSFQ